MREQMSLYQGLFCQRQKTHQSIKRHYHNPKRSILEKKQQKEQWRRAEEGTSEEQPKDMRKYIKDLNDAFIAFCQLVVILAYCFLKKIITLFEELTLFMIRVKPDVGRIHEQQQKKTRLDQGRIFIVRNTHTRQFNTYWRRLPNTGTRTTQHRIDIIRKHQHYKLIKQWMNLEDMPFTLNFLKTTRARKKKNY